jgi:hypothetical protein
MKLILTLAALLLARGILLHLWKSAPSADRFFPLD